MKQYFYGDHNAQVLLVQAVDDHDLAFLEEEYEAIRALSPGRRILLAAFLTDSWNQDLSPWEAPPVFGSEGFGNGAEETLTYVLQGLLPAAKRDCGTDPDQVPVVIGGYSLAGLFALWAATRTDRFAACAAASPSVWFPDWISYVRDHPLRTDRVYLSLGKKESKTRNPLMRQVDTCIRDLYDLLEGKERILEWNEGNHFRDPAGRTARAFAWCLRD